MYANVVMMRYKSPSDLEKGVEKLKPLVDMLPSNPGFQSFMLVRISDTETVNVVGFETRENALAARERMLPKAKEAAGPFLASPPEPHTGEILVRK